MRETVTCINICSGSPGSWSPFEHVDYNLIYSDSSFHLYAPSKNSLKTIYSSPGLPNILAYIRNACPQSAIIGHLVYEPGRTYPLLDHTLFDSFILRLGDIHHLANPLTQAYQFSLSHLASTVFFNTTPHWVPLFSLLGISASFWSDLSESGRFSHSLLHYDHVSKSRVRDPNIFFLGSPLSLSHARRTYFVNKILSSPSPIRHLPASEHNIWFSNLAQAHFVVAPTLNSQISHNLYTPPFLGCVVLTDHLAFPSGLPCGFPVIEFPSPKSITDFINLPSSELMTIWHSYFPTSRPSSVTSALHSEPNGGFCSYDYTLYAKMTRPHHPLSAPPVPPGFQSEGLSPLLFLNILEILQEIHRVSIDSILVELSSEALHFLTADVLTLPRIFLLYNENLSSRSLRISALSNQRTSLVLSWTRPTSVSDHIMPNYYIEEYMVQQFSCFSGARIWHHRLHSCLSCSVPRS